MDRQIYRMNLLFAQEQLHLQSIITPGKRYCNTLHNIIILNSYKKRVRNTTAIKKRHQSMGHGPFALG